MDLAGRPPQPQHLGSPMSSHVQTFLSCVYFSLRARADCLFVFVPNIRDEQSPDADKWKQRRNHSFDQNRHLEEITKERDSFKRVACTLQRVVSQLVAYCAAAEDELNKTVLTELLAHVLPPDTLSGDEESRPSTPNTGSDINNSSLSRSGGKRVHFAPDLRNVLSVLDEGVDLQFQQQKDLSLEIKNELETSLMRLRSEAQELLELSAKVAKNRTQRLSLGKNQVEITELVDNLDNKEKSCDNCELHRKNMEEAMAECVQREGLLRTELESAMLRIARLMNDDQHHDADVIAEGYGTLQHPRAPLSLPVRPSARTPPPIDSRSTSADGSHSPRGQLARLVIELDAAQRERDDLAQQLEAANRQLRSTRQFVEEQAAERETERDDFARQLRDLREENARLAQRLQSNARILSEVEQLESQTKEMNQIIADLELRKTATDEELKASSEKVSLLRDIISNLESQLEQKTSELESLRSERNDHTNVSCLHCAGAVPSEEEDGDGFLAKVKEQARWLEECLHRRTQKLERIHESISSTSCSEPSEDVSLKDHKKPSMETNSSESPEPRRDRLLVLAGVWECLDAHARAEDAAIKRVADLEMQRAQLKDIAQEVRAERDVLQTRMSEQALRVSTLQARLERQRDEAETSRREATSELLVKLHDATSEVIIYHEIVTILSELLQRGYLEWHLFRNMQTVTSVRVSGVLNITDALPAILSDARHAVNETLKVQRLKEELEVKEKQMARLRKSIEEKDKLNEEHASLYGNSCHPKDKVVILERELSDAQTKIAQLETVAKSLETEKDSLQQLVRDSQRQLAERNAQLQELLALKLDDDNQKTENKSDNVDGAKNSARTLSDIVSISDYDEQDLQMRRYEMKYQNVNISSIQHLNERDKSFLQKTVPDDHDKPNISSLNLDCTPKQLECTPRAESLPTHLTSTQNKNVDLLNMYKRNVNETTVFGSGHQFDDSPKHSTAQKIPDNCSMFPNRDVSDTKNITVDPKRIDFSLEPSNVDHRSDEDEPDFTSLEELGIVIDFKQQSFPDIFSQLKNEVKKSRNELESCRSKLKHAEEQLCEFPALKEEVEELKNLLENTMSTMKNDKMFYENQLGNFTSSKKLLDQRLAELTQEVNDKAKDLHLLKEDILRRENMILELAKEKRNLTNKMAELEVKVDELQNRNAVLQKCESENLQMREKIGEIQKLQHLVSEKNQQIDSLNQHLDRLDDLQRRLDDKTEQLESVKEALEEKSNELFQLQDTVEAVSRDLNNITNENSKLVIDNRELKQLLTKLEKEQENASLRLQNSENEVEKLNSINNEFSKKLEDMKSLTNQLKDKECEIEILNEDIKNFHEEIASLKEQLKIGSRSPSPRRSKSGDEGSGKMKQVNRQATEDKKQLIKIRKQISLLQHELDFNKKELNEKAFELARAKLDITELKNALHQATTKISDKEICVTELTKENNNMKAELEELSSEKEEIRKQLATVMSRLSEEGSLKELKEKLRVKEEQCLALEQELKLLKEMFEKMHDSSQRHRAIQSTEEQDLALVIRSGNRSPTTELENAVRAQLNYSNQLDDSIMEQILSGSSDVEDVPRLALNTSKSSSSVHSSSSEKIGRLKSENEKLQMQLNNLEARIKDKDALITELNR
ncbi:hypothetical protein EVAR_78691_1 [Eumeta japonica]|uniref:Uncharacterized protein n=1 Tax=Eumeta variegata TaxID=151549 RepID=A0A4C1U7W8_EUMVA|nr:hypothetical protein EVAR_78691_1 [Eumeta japonica]